MVFLCTAFNCPKTLPVPAMQKNNFYVITGGPGGGKTTLLKELQKQGINYVPETARQIIKNRVDAGLSPRPAPPEFALQVFIQDVEAFTANLHVTNTLFFDRSFIDSAAMLYEADKQLYDTFKPLLEEHRYNNLVFITPPWQDIYVTDNERDQTFEQAVQVYNKLYSWYIQMGYTIAVLPETGVEERVGYIMQCLNPRQ